MLWNRWSKKSEIKIWNEKRKITKNRKLFVFVFFDVLLDQTFLKVRKNLWKIWNVDFSSESFIFFRTTKRDFNKTTKKYFTITFIIKCSTFTRSGTRLYLIYFENFISCKEYWDPLYHKAKWKIWSISVLALVY